MTATEEIWVTLDTQSTAPAILSDLTGVDVEFLRQFGQGLVVLQRCAGHFRLECRRIIPSGSSHFCSHIPGVLRAHRSTFSTYRPVLFCRPLSAVH